jgi:single-strand DNA-binding protein
MNDTTVTVIGNVATHPRVAESGAGPTRVSFRLAATPRRLDRATGQWADGTTSWYTVTCWRVLAENVAASFHKGDPVVVTGRQRIREWTSEEGRAGIEVEIEATHAGHDLNRGRSSFVKVTRTREPVPPVEGALEASPGPDVPVRDGVATGAGEAGGFAA